MKVSHPDFGFKFLQKDSAPFTYLLHGAESFLRS